MYVCMYVCIYIGGIHNKVSKEKETRTQGC
jgi:hypothetical protein